MESKILYYLEQIAKLRNGEYVPPISCEIDPSNKCTMQCSFCMFERFKKENHVHLDWDIYKRVLTELNDEGVRSITFTGGGEPMLHPRINDMVKLALDLGFQIGMVTNGVYAGKVAESNRFKFIRISINAGNEVDYKKITGVNSFQSVVNNTEYLVNRGAFVGWSFVVTPDNKRSIKEAQGLAADIGVKYIQFKPAWINGQRYDDYYVPGEKKTIDTRRYDSNKSNLPCLVAHLVGIICADARLYYCCQKRGKMSWSMGTLKDNTFKALWKKRLERIPHSVASCPHCRYMNYAHAYEDFILNSNIFDSHKDFL